MNKYRDITNVINRKLQISLIKRYAIFVYFKFNFINPLQKAWVLHILAFDQPKPIRLSTTYAGTILGIK